MFPHPCGEDLERAIAAGADPATAVPDEYVVVRGGTKPIPPERNSVLALHGPDLEAAACAVPYNQMRLTTAGAIRNAGGIVVWKVE